MSQNFDGSWGKELSENVKGYYVELLVDSLFEKELGYMGVEIKHYDNVKSTIIGIRVLEELFQSKKVEWNLIHQKGANYLKKVGVTDVNALAVSLNLKLAK
jgi:hypothetical protein